MHPILIQTKLFTIHTYWVFITIAIIVGTYTLIRLSVKNSLKINFISENSWKLILWSIVGARIVTLIFNIDTYFYAFSKDTILQLFYIWDKGLNIWGGLIAFFGYLYYISKKNEQNFYKWLEVLVPSIILAFAISSLGAFFEGTNYGNETNLPWGVNFESPTIKYTVPIHPTQIYSFLYSIGIFIGLILISRTDKINNIEKPGFIGLLGIISYSFFKFLEEFFRGDDVFMIYGVRVPQIISLVVFISAGIFLITRYNKPRKKRSKKTK